ncbi:transposase, partial [Enterococcus faecium]|nr:transposase [Enterococcus faecium]
MFFYYSTLFDSRFKTLQQNQIAKVGYNSTKKSYFYGLKIHMIVTKTGFPITYSITNPGVHD